VYNSNIASYDPVSLWLAAMKWTDSVARRIKLKDLQIVLAVARSRSMGRAAADLAISQPAISRAIGDWSGSLASNCSIAIDAASSRPFLEMRC